MRKLTRSFRLHVLAATAAAALLCVAPPADATSARSFGDMLKDMPLLPPDAVAASDSAVLAKVRDAVAALKRQDLDQAHEFVNQALQLDPRNSWLHFLNGFVYQLQARQGDTQKGELAIEGYEQALRLDPGNWIAQEFLGLAAMDLKQFERARQAFSEVLAMTPDSSVSLDGLMVSSYLSGDARTACAMADQYRKTVPQPERSFVQSSVAVYASCGEFAQSERMRDALAHLDGDAADLQRIDRRLSQWRAVYRAAPAATPSLVKTTFDLSPPAADKPVQLAQAFTLPASAYPPGVKPTPPLPGAVPAVAATTAAPTKAASDGNDPHMVLVDVVLLSTQELMTTSKGINLLSALTLQLGNVAGNVAAWSRAVTRTVATGSAGSLSTTVTHAVTVPALSYSLNIANANNQVNEVLARPTLAAMDGVASEFFSGTNLSAGVVSTSTQGGTTVVPVDKRFGVKLSVTPTFLPGGRVQLKVDASRTSLNATLDNPKVAYQIEIAETSANANVVMKLGDTLVLSGLSEKGTISTRDGVPFLQDVPVVQYLFSNQQTNDVQNSVLILVTPRAPVELGQSPEAASESMESRMKALREKFGFAGGNPANVEAILGQLQENELFREFRQGDVSMERWERMRSTGERLKEALGFLYY